MQQSELLKGALDLAVLGSVGRGESYGYEVLQRLAAAGLEGVGDASVYGSLKRLESQGYLRVAVGGVAAGSGAALLLAHRRGRHSGSGRPGRCGDEFASAIDAVLEEGRRA